MSATRSSIRVVAIVLGALLVPAGLASAQHRGGGHGGGGHFSGSHSVRAGHYGGGGHSGGYYSRGYYSRGHYGGYYGSRYYPRLFLYGGLYGSYGYPYYYRYPYYAYDYGYPYAWYGGYAYGGPGNGRYEYADVEESGGERERSGGQLGGELRLNVRPDDAVVYVDGEFRGPARRVARLTLTPGRHLIEVVRPGHEPFERVIDIGRDRPVDLDVELRASAQ